MISFELYGTALCQSILGKIQEEAHTVPSLVEAFGNTLSGREKRNLDRRIRRALDTLEAEGYVEMQWSFTNQIPLKKYECTAKAARTEKPLQRQS